MADDITPKILAEIRDAIRDNGRRIDATNARLDETNARLDDTNARLDDTNAHLHQTNERISVLATLTRSIDGRLEKIEAREADRVLLPRRVDALETARDDHEARIAALEER